MSQTMWMSPTSIERYRNTRQIAWTKQRQCSACKRMRSIGQYQGDSTRCLQCQRRQVPDEC